MLRRITRYLGFDLFAVFFLTVTTLTMLIMLAFVGQEAVRHNLGIGPIVRILPFVFPMALQFALPGTILLTVCIVYGRMSAANEIVALKSAGVSPMAVLRPAYVVAILISGVAVCLNDVAVSWGELGVRRVVLQSIEEIAYGMLRTHLSFQRNDFEISVRRVDGKTLIEPSVEFYGNDASRSITVNADTAELGFDPEKNTLWFQMVNVLGESDDDIEFHYPGKYLHSVPLDPQSDGRFISPSNLAIRQIPAELVKTENFLLVTKQQLAGETALHLLTGEFDRLTWDSWRRRVRSLQSAQGRLHRLETEPWRRCANGFSCFFFVLVGAPLAIRLRTADFWVTFGLCFLPTLIIYYPLLVYGTSAAKSGDLPPYCVWIGNFVLAIVGWWLYRGVKRY